MTTHMNGTELPSIDTTEETPAEKAAAERAATNSEVKGSKEQARALIDAQVRQVIGVMVRGVMVSAQGVEPVEVLNSIARVTGSLCSGAVQGDVGTMLTIRNTFVKCFEDGVKSAPLLKPATPANVPPRRG